MNHHRATNSDFASTTLDKILNHRGILAAAQRAQWQPQGNGWKYPVYDLSGTVLTYRYKAANSSAKPKYKWDKRKPDDCQYYLLPGLQEAIDQYNGLVYIASGEPDVLAFKSAGIDNVLCWFGETSVPPNLATFLRELGVQYVITYPDRDRTGYKAAEKIAAALQGSGIHLHAAALPDYLGDKGDINKLWQYVEFDRAAFIAALANDTQHLEIELPKPKPQRRKPKQDNNQHHSYFAAIEQVLGIDAYKGNGWSKKSVPCPFNLHEHDDTRPSARWHRDKHILHCFKCGETYLAKQVGAALGIEWKDFTAAPDGLPRPTLEMPLDGLYHFLQGIPDTLREAFLGLHYNTSVNDHCPALIVLELRQHAISEQHLRPEEPLTVNWLIDYAARIDRHTSQGVIRRGLQQLTDLKFVEISQIEPPMDGTVPAGCKGRPTNRYHPQPLAEALPRLHEALRRRIRERIFSDQTPDTVTPEWFADYPPEVARQLAELENIRRQSLYEEHEAARQQAEQQYAREVEKMQGGLSLERLLCTPSTPLSADWPCKDSRDYRALYYHSQVADAGEAGRTIARVRAAAQLGVSSKTLSVLRVKAGITADEQFETMQITNPENVLEQVNEQFRWAARRDFGKFLDNGKGGKRGLSRSSPEEVDRWVKDELARGHTVTVYVQTASRERLATEQEQRDKTQAYENKRAGRRHQRQSRPPIKGDKPPDLLERLLAQVIEETCPRGFSTTYVLRQIAMAPHRDEAELLEYIDLFSNLHPLKEAYLSRGGKNENKSEMIDALPGFSSLFQQQRE